MGALPSTLTAQNAGFREWLNRQDQRFAGFRNQKDAAFARLIATEWQNVNSVPAQTLTAASPKLTAPPVVGPTDVPATSIPDLDAIPATEPQDARLSVPGFAADPLASLQAASGASSTALSLSVDIRGLSFEFSTAGLPFPEFAEVSEEWLAVTWSEWAKADTSAVPLWRQVLQGCQASLLSDWGCLLLAQEAATTIFPGADTRLANVFAWYALTKAEWGVQIGFSATQIFLLVPVDAELYGVPSVQLGDRDLYVVAAPGEKVPDRLGLRTYGVPDDTRGRPLSLLAPSMDIGRSVGVREFGFSIDGQPAGVKIAYNRSAVAWLDEMPQTEMSVLLAAPLSSRAMADLHAVLHPLLEPLSSDAERLNLLLRFVQVAFPYAVDQDQFGEERYLWPEETLHFPFSDCEDRVFLLAALVREFLGLESIALDYPGHVALAVAWPSGAPAGDFIRWREQNYIVADPTYIGANAGMTMPHLSSVTPVVIPPRHAGP